MAIELRELGKSQNSAYGDFDVAQARCMSFRFMIEFFSFLDGKDVAVCTQVCRVWRKNSSRNELWYNVLKLRVREVKPDHQLSAYVPNFPYKKAWMVFHVKKFPFESLTGGMLAGAYSDIYNDREMSRPTKAAAFIGHAVLTTLSVLAIPITMGLDRDSRKQHTATRAGEFCECYSCHTQEGSLKEATKSIFQELAKVLPRRPDAPQSSYDNGPTHYPFT